MVQERDPRPDPVLGGCATTISVCSHRHRPPGVTRDTDDRCPVSTAGPGIPSLFPLGRHPGAQAGPSRGAAPKMGQVDLWEQKPCAELGELEELGR
ncbi:hypothetical protein AV530_009438 [Patagioenas fasciata monilis]|uniref:Uncharacterized protein n=1 Tax=Patagioenas fasciata monilis TaxID=372326 RepID=A0A1V4L297_PATFA|nr:hypothetical protein AV530_009438 [Patagioenas fasciata monilis]